MRVGLNNFLRFISANGVSKVNQVLEALQDYRDWKDYYRDFREEAVLALVSRNTDRLRHVVSDDSKARHYEKCLAGLER